MPSTKVLNEKKAMVASMTEKLKSSCAGVVVEYKGITVEDDTKLRKELRDSEVEYFVMKNTLLKRATEEAGLSELSPALHGSTAIAISKEDPIVAFKVLCDFAKDHEFFKIKSGFIEGNVVDSKEAVRLAKLPPKEILIAQTLRGLNAPITGLATALSGIMKGLVVALNAIAEKKNVEN